jgi:uncharacterized membrane protein (UPF0136 family)
MFIYIHTISYYCQLLIATHAYRGRPGRDCMVVGLTTIVTINAYHH